VNKYFAINTNDTIGFENELYSTSIENLTLPNETLAKSIDLSRIGTQNLKSRRVVFSNASSSKLTNGYLKLNINS
jgi:hypothetical protein